MALVDYMPKDTRLMENGTGPTGTVIFSRTKGKYPPKVRAKVARLLHSEGWSQQRIAAALRVSQGTTSRDLQTLASRDRVDELERDLALAGCRIDELTAKLVAVGVDPDHV